MTRDGLAYDDGARARRRTLGYAEADPTLDVDGTDTAHKLAILAQLAFGANVRTGRDPPRGDRPAPARRHQVRRRAGLHGQAAGAGQAVGRGAGAAGRADAGQARHPAGRGPRPVQRHPGRGRRRRRHALLRPGRGDDADRLGGRRRPDRRRRRPRGADLASPGPLGRHGPAPPDPRQPGPEPLLSPVHDRRPAGRARRARAGARRARASASPASSSTTPATTPPRTAPCRSSS